jgi:putative two-component system response regulator
LRDIVCREVVVVRSGRAEGVVGCVCDETSHAPGATGSIPADDARIDEVTGLLDMRGFMVAKAAFEDAYALGERDFAVVMVGVENLWETNAVFGPKHGARVLSEIARRIREACGKSGVVARVSGTEFAILTQTGDRQVVEEMLGRVGDAISSITVVDGHACSPLYAMGYGFASEAHGFESLMRLVSNRMRDGLAGRRLRSDDGIERMSHEDAIRRLQLLQPYFSTVRLVDPSCAQARLLEKDGRGFSEPSLCYGVWKAKHRCVNCISARTLATRTSQSKYEFRDDKVFFVNTQYVEVDGEPRVIEMVRALDFDIDGSSESGRHLRAAITARDLARYAYAEVPRDAGIFNRAYFDDIMAVLTSEDMVVVEILVRKEDGSLRQPSAGEMGAAAMSLKSCVRPDDTVICYDAETLMVIFAQALPETALDGRLRVIRRRAELGLRRETPRIDAAMTMVAVCRRDKASALAKEATRLLGKARESGEEFVVARG